MTYETIFSEPHVAYSVEIDMISHTNHREET